jgi:hypothetical protein
VVGPVVLELGDDHADDDHAGEHDEGSTEKHGLAADLIDDQHSGDGRDDEDDTGHTGGQEGNGTAGQAETDEDVGSVVNN